MKVIHVKQKSLLEAWDLNLLSHSMWKVPNNHLMVGYQAFEVMESVCVNIMLVQELTLDP